MRAETKRRRETGSGRHWAPPSAHLALFIVQLTFSGLHVIGKYVLETVHPFALAALRVLVATPVLLALAWRRDRVFPRRSDLPLLALLGLLGVFLNQILFISGLQLTLATNAAILITSIPVFAAAIGAAFGVERFGPGKLLGLMLTVAGALVLVNPFRFSFTGSMLGDFLVLANCLSYAGFLVAQRPALERLPWRTVIAWSFAWGSLGVLTVGGRHLPGLFDGSLSTATWIGIGYVILFPTILAYSLNTWAVNRSSPALAAGYTTLQPLLTAILAAIFLSEVLGWRQAVGFAAIAAGLILAARRNRS